MNSQISTTHSCYDTLSAEESPDALIITTPTGDILHWNAGAESVFGFTREEAVGRRLMDLLVPPDRSGEEERLRSDTLCSGLITFESLRRRKDGTLVYVDVSSKVICDPLSSRSLILSTEKDVTQLRVLRETRLVEARFQELLESTPDSIVMANPTGHIVFANSHAETLFGYERSELLGKPVEVLLPQRFRAGHLGYRSKYSGQPRTRPMGAGLELFGQRKDGAEFPVEISLSPLQMEDTTLVISAIRDITDRKRFEQALREKNIELENASRAKDRFLATMSHELRTPLNAVIGFTGTLLMRLPGPLTPEQETQLQTVQSSARHLLSLINDLLDLAKIEAGKLELSREPVDCRAVMEEVAASLRVLAEKKGLKFLLTPPAEALSLNTNHRALSQILINLTANAIKYTERGSVHLRAQRRQGPRRGRIAIDVEDTGSGIRPEDQQKLFEAFSRIDAAAHAHSPGTGLGLHLSRKLAELLGGRISFESEYGRGSTFTLELQEE